MSRGLLIIDIQRDYFRGGRHPLPGAEAAAEAAAALLERFRTRGEPILHLQHVWDEPDAPFFRPGTDGVEIHPLVVPAPAEPLIVKDAPNGFMRTELEAQLRTRGIDSLVVAGMMSSMCVDATVRAALDLGFDAVVAHDACAAPDLEFGGNALPANMVHGAFMAALAEAGAELASAGELADD
jgi:nicotinamidase-related amidase